MRLTLVFDAVIIQKNRKTVRKTVLKKFGFYDNYLDLPNAI